MEPATTRLGHALAKILGIKLQNCNDPGREELTKNESVFSNSTVDTYVEEEPRTIDWVRDVIPESQDIKRYVFNLFPFTRWIKKYNTQWAIGDAVAGREPNFLCRINLTDSSRYNCWCGCGATINGLCSSSSVTAGIWSLLLIYGSNHILVFGHVQRRDHWRKFVIVLYTHNYNFRVLIVS